MVGACCVLPGVGLVIRFVAPSGRIFVEVAGLEPFDGAEMANDSLWLQRLPATVNERLRQLTVQMRGQRDKAATG